MVRARRSGSMAERITDLERRVTSLTRELHRFKTAENGAVVLRSIPREQARDEILAAFQSGETLFYSDIVHRLALDIGEVVEICAELERDGRIETLGDSA